MKILIFLDVGFSSSVMVSNWIYLFSRFSSFELNVNALACPSLGDMLPKPEISSEKNVKKCHDCSEVIPTIVPLFFQRASPNALQPKNLMAKVTFSGLILFKRWRGHEKMSYPISAERRRPFFPDKGCQKNSTRMALLVDLMDNNVGQDFLQLSTARAIRDFSKVIQIWKILYNFLWGVRVQN